MYKRLAIAFSVANLCFFKSWSEVLSSPALDYLYFWKVYPGYSAVIAHTINILLLTAIFYAGFHLVWRVGTPTFHNLARATFLVIFLRALNSVRAQIAGLNTHELRLVVGRTGYFAIGTALLLFLVLVTVRYGLPRIARVAAVVALVLAPLGVLLLAQATWLTIKYGQGWHERSAAPILKPRGNAQPRVLWLIFDEMDERLVFSDRPTSLSLPNLDRLRAEGLLATNAFPPAGHTSQSIPALLTGRLIAAVKPSGPNELMLTFPEQQPVGWSTQPDVFTESRAAGINTAVVGWLHPYCRVIGDRVTSCLWEQISITEQLTPLGIGQRILRQDIDLLPLLPFTGKIRDRWRQRSPEEYRLPVLATYQKLMAAAKRAATDPSLGLTFVHLPIPHPPYIYDRNKGTWDTTGEREYLDNLALADKALGALRLAMERAGTWDSTTILISSDHWWRTDYWRSLKLATSWSAADEKAGDRVDHRIPFLIRMPGQKTALTYEAPFNTVLSHDLILEVLKQRISSAEQIPAWLDMHRTIGESPYQSYEDPVR